MDDYFKDWLTVIDGMNNENTYKLAWGRAIIELCHSFDVVEGVPTVFTFQQIGEYVLKYFWNQTYFFKLYQGPAKSRPKIQQITEEVIEYYQSITQSKIPDWFDKSKPILIRDKVKYNRFLKEISTALKNKNEGDIVKVPFGADNTVRTGRVESISYHTCYDVPYDLNRTKFIIEKDVEIIYNAADVIEELVDSIEDDILVITGSLYLLSDIYKSLRRIQSIKV